MLHNAVVPFALIGVLSVPAGAQLSGKGFIVGIVKDPSGAILAGAVITATNSSTSTIARTSPVGLQSPADYDLDISLRRTFGLGLLHLGEGPHVTIEGDLYNLTNHTQFGGIGTVVGSANFGQVSVQSNLPSDAQLSARIEFQAVWAGQGGRFG